MKVGILTFHNVINYGGVLQCYALQQTLLKEGFQVEVINYENAYFKKFYSPFYISKPFARKFLYMLYAFPQKCIRNKKFAQFRGKYLKESVKYTSQNVKQADENYDAIISGSDQVWNLILTDNDENYFLPFVTKALKIAYAASIGLKEIPDELKSRYSTLIKGFDSVSVREESAAKLVERLTGVESQVCIDPVLLLGQENWMTLAEDSDILANEKYILVYKINKSVCYAAARELQKKTGLKVVVIKPDKTCDRKFEKYRCASPVEFVSLFKRAQYVITDSFHGTVFSVLFEKQFAYYMDRSKDNRNVRILNLLDKLGISSRNYEIESDVKKIDDFIDYESVKNKLDRERQASKNYLINSISGDK